MSRKASIEIGRRAAEECRRLFPGKSVYSIGCIVGRNRKVVEYWQNGGAPGAMFLARLHYLGADVIYILTGEKQHD